MRGWLRRTVGGLPRQFWFLWAGTLINRVGAFVVILMAIYLTGERHLSQSAAGLVIGLYGAGGAIGTVAGGVLADRWGRRPTLLVAQFGAAALMLGLGTARGYGAILTAAFLLGMFAEAARPAFAAMMVDIVPDADRLRAYSLNYWAINLGFAVAAVAAGFAAQFDYLLVFAVDAATTVVTAVISLLFLTESRPAVARSRSERRPADPGLRTVFRDRVFVVFLLLNLGAVIVMFQHQSTMPIAMTADGLSPSTYGLVIAVNGVLIVAGQLFVPRLIDGRDRSGVLAFATLVVGLGFGLGTFADTAAFWALSVLVWTLGEMLQSPSNAALIAELSPVALRGRYQGVTSLSWSVGAALAPILGGFVQQHLGDAALWLGCALVGVSTAAGQWVSGPARERRAASLRTADARLTVAAAVTTPPPGTAAPLADVPPDRLRSGSAAAHD